MNLLEPDQNDKSYNHLIQLIMIHGNFQQVLDYLGDILEQKKDVVVIDKSNIFFWTNMSPVEITKILKKAEELYNFNFILVDIKPEKGFSNIISNMDKSTASKFESIKPLIENNYNTDEMEKIELSVDGILEKINETGYTSLDEQEIEFLIHNTK